MSTVRKALNGVLVVNSFLSGPKFTQLYDMLTDAAVQEGVHLDVRPSSKLYWPIGGRPGKRYDFALFWDKDLLLARAFERAGTPVFNSSRSIELCDDKALTAEALMLHGVKSPKTLSAPKAFSNIGYTDGSFLSRAERYLGYPMIIKQRFGSFGAQVYLAADRKEALKILSNCGGNEVILQDFISESSGRDVRINVVGGEICGCMLRYNDHDFRSNITNGGKMKAFDPPKEFKELALCAARAVSADFAGVDVLFGKDGPLICEVNASPHFKTTFEATGVDLAQKIITHVKRSVDH